LSTLSTKFQFQLADPTDAFDNDKFIKSNFQKVEDTVYNKTEVDAKAVYGTNANGDYIKFDNGVLICHNTVNAIAGTTLQTISGLTFPLPFVGSTPEVQVTHRSVSGKFANWYVLNPTTTTFSIVHQGVSAADLTGTLFSWTAIGKWK
jgi:hypothetical protein